MLSDEQVVALMAAFMSGTRASWTAWPALAMDAQDLFDAVRAERMRRAKERGETDAVPNL